MRQLFQEAANSEEDARSPMAKWLRSIGRVLMRSLSISSAGANPAPDRLNSKPRLHLTLESSAGALNLAVANRSRVEIWAEEATVDLVDVETNGEVYSPAQSVLKIREPIAPSEILRISLINTVYNTAGRPQAMYSCTIAAVLRFRTDAFVEDLEQPFPFYRAKMVALIPTSLRRLVRFDRSSGSSKLQDLSAVGRGEQSKRVRRSKRTTAQSAVVVEGRFSDGTPFVTATRALVLSAHDNAGHCCPNFQWISALRSLCVVPALCVSSSVRLFMSARVSPAKFRSAWVLRNGVAGVLGNTVAA